MKAVKKNNYKVSVVCGLIVLFGLVQANASVSQTWSANNTGGWLYNSLGSLLAADGNYQIQMVIDVNGDTDMSALSSGYLGLNGDGTSGSGLDWSTVIHSSASDDVIWTLDQSVWEDATSFGAAYHTYISPSGASTIDETQYGGDYVYFRWFNSTSQASASEAGFIWQADGLPLAEQWWLNNAPDDTRANNIALDYDLTTAQGTSYTGTGTDGWATVAPVPEPGTMALFALGLATLGVSRRRRKVQA